jgi:hypothetical protein
MVCVRAWRWDMHNMAPKSIKQFLTKCTAIGHSKKNVLIELIIKNIFQNSFYVTRKIPKFNGSKNFLAIKQETYVSPLEVTKKKMFLV